MVSVHASSVSSIDLEIADEKLDFVFKNNNQIQNCSVYGLRPSSGILNTRKYNILEIESVSFFRCGEGDAYSVEVPLKELTSITVLRFALSEGHNKAGVSLPSP
jgi:hypothetical protein